MKKLSQIISQKLEEDVITESFTEAFGESWVVYNKDTKAKIKSFKSRKGAYEYAAKNGGVVYSAEYYHDNQNEIKSGKLEMEESFDGTPLILRKLSEIIEKADDAYNTISSLEESNADIQTLVNSLAHQVDALYEQIDADLGIIPVQLDEALAWKLMNQNLTKLGFERIEHPSKDTYTTTKARIQHLYGIPMRAGKYADTLFVILDTDTKPYGIVDSEGTTFYENLGDALKELNKRAKKGELEESSLEEVLNPNDDASVWIDDFVKSDNKRFAGKSKEERIKMALGAWYAAQKKEDVTHDEVIDNSEVDEAVITDYNTFAKQHKKMYPSHTENQTKLAWETYSKHFNKKESEETSIDKAEINNKIIALKSSLASIQAKQKQTDYNQKYDSATRATHNKRLMEVPKKLKELQNSLIK